MGCMTEVGKKKLQAVLTGVEFQFCFRLTTAEVNSIFIGRNWLVEGWQVPVNQQVVMPRSRAFYASRATWTP